MAYADLFIQTGDLTKASEFFNKALITFKECGASGWIRMIETRMASIQ